LPESIGIGSGKIFDHDGLESNQVDVVLYDKSSPILRFSNNIAYFPVEAVAAVVEVKSYLNAIEIGHALDNTLSVARLKSKWQLFHRSDNTSPENSINDEDWRMPGLYVFGYNGYRKNRKMMAEAVKKWTEERKESLLKLNYARLGFPRVVATPTAVMVRPSNAFDYDSALSGTGNIRFAVSVNDAALHALVFDLTWKAISRVANPKVTSRNIHIKHSSIITPIILSRYQRVCPQS